MTLAHHLHGDALIVTVGGVQTSQATSSTASIIRLCRKQQGVGDFSTLRLAKKAAEQATDE